MHSVFLDFNYNSALNYNSAKQKSVFHYTVVFVLTNRQHLYHNLYIYKLIYQFIYKFYLTEFGSDISFHINFNIVLLIISAKRKSVWL